MIIDPYGNRVFIKAWSGVGDVAYEIVSRGYFFERRLRSAMQKILEYEAIMVKCQEYRKGFTT